MSIQGRLARLEQRCLPEGQAHLWLAFVDDQGRILDDRSEAMQRWVGRHYSELPQPVSIIVGCDALVVLGFKEPPPRGSGPAVGDAESQLPGRAGSLPD